MTKKEKEIILNTYKTIASEYYLHMVNCNVDKIENKLLQKLELENMLNELKIDFTDINNNCYTCWFGVELKALKELNSLSTIFKRNKLNNDITDINLIETKVDELQFINVDDFNYALELLNRLKVKRGISV